MKKSIRMRWLMALVGISLLPVMSSAQASKTDLTGKWTFSVTTDNGTGTPTVSLAQKGDSLSGNYSSQVFGEQAIKGAVTGNRIAFMFTASLEGQSLIVRYTGTIEADGTIQGGVDLGGLGSGTFTATRQKP